MDLVNVAPSQFRLQRDSASQISMQRYNGAFLPVKINGVWQAKQIPAGGVALGNAGLVAATSYFIYHYVTGGAITLEASTTGYATDADTGLPVKSGDPTRVLDMRVQMGPGSPGTFVDSATQAFLANYWNRRNRRLANAFTANRTTASGTFVELNTEIRIEAVVWADEAMHLMSSGTAFIDNVTFPSLWTGLGEDGATSIGAVEMNTGVNGAAHNQAVGAVTQPSEGYHFWTLLGKTAGGRTGTWLGGADETAGRCRLMAAVRG